MSNFIVAFDVLAVRRARDYLARVSEHWDEAIERLAKHLES
jgi:hypothetical protein